MLSTLCLFSRLFIILTSVLLILQLPDEIVQQALSVVCCLLAKDLLHQLSVT